MDASEFIKIWTAIGVEHLHADSSNMGLFDFGSAALDFLFITGMPSEFQELNFDDLKQKKLKTVNQKYSLENPDYDNYLAIGFNGSGDPIAIRLDNQELVYLNHDKYFEEVFINSDLKKFAMSVLRIRDFETEFSDEQFDVLIRDLKSIDSKIFEQENSHWIFLINYYKWEKNKKSST